MNAVNHNARFDGRGEGVLDEVAGLGHVVEKVLVGGIETSDFEVLRGRNLGDEAFASPEGLEFVRNGEDVRDFMFNEEGGVVGCPEVADEETWCDF